MNESAENQILKEIKLLENKLFKINCMYSIKDFCIGEEVYHLSNSNVKMIVIDINIENNKLHCQWIDNTKKEQNGTYILEAIGKWIDINKNFLDPIIKEFSIARKKGISKRKFALNKGIDPSNFAKKVKKWEQEGFLEKLK